MRTPDGAGPAGAPAVDVSAQSRDIAVTLVTLIMALVVGLTFLFGFGNVLQLGLRLGVPIWIAPLVAPAVDLSVVGLLLGTRQLALRGAPVELLRPARRLLVFSSIVTLALNIAEPVIAGDYAKAAFDSVGPLLLIGWSEVGPGLLQAMRHPPACPQNPSNPPAGVDATPPAPAPIADGGIAAPPSASPEVPRQRRSAAASGGLSDEEWLAWARREDALYWEENHRPISSDELRRRLHVGSKRARSLVTQLRAEARRVLDEHSSAGVPTMGGPLPESLSDSGGGGDRVELVEIGPAEPADPPGVLAAVG
ncbi:hypothetical protein CcI6DRAFT_04184 [Frankia sp. CcI6]|uniref:hypothetical protein n=1 Tax=unclassified Frankia TaxID=2632575 RepID=UPI0003CFF2E8|nr:MULTISPECIES: hypothetical protein [unclassified Frankia]ETA00429.1 hypothetical protein CcI6DRAFT_04184 [Frankia sp. CcI6]KFB03021.1 hypothetical protein ALLO2DRAFT_04196 [Frankia sp. Allo2]OHV51098.1 hypothetical protein CgIS1_19505 [Frankia sp. CgIS1]